MLNTSTKIIAAGLVDEGVAFEKLEKRCVELEKLISLNKPVCPFCKKELTPEQYKGYYDSFDYWGCDCDKLPDSKKWHGSYVC
jgi:tRNA(Ile2) C34 agmatinyltransferase TiaS